MIRPERPADIPAVQELLRAAFGGDLEATMAVGIRASTHAIPDLTFVAEQDGVIVGQVMLWSLDLHDGDARHRVICLGPIAVLPALQRTRIGSALMRYAIAAADARGEPLIVLEGSPAYYPRFGFRYAMPFGITHTLPSWAPAEASMVLPLTNYRPEIRGHVVYPAAAGLPAE